MGHIVKRLVDSVGDYLTKSNHHDVDDDHTSSQFRRGKFLDVHWSDACRDADTDTDQEPVSDLRRVKRFSLEGGGSSMTHHRPHVVAHRLANGTTYEDYICDTEYEPAANVVRQGACPKRTKKSSECRSGSDQFLQWGGGDS